MRDIVLVDTCWIYNKAFYSNSELSWVAPEEVYLTGGMYGSLRTINFLKRRYKCPIVACIEPENNRKRYQINEEYKATRKRKDPRMWKCYRDTLQAMMLFKNVFVVSSEDDGEADDCLYSFVKINKDKFDRVFLHASDNDLIQIAGIPDLKAEIFYTAKGLEEPDISLSDYCQEKYEIKPENILLFRSIVGDTSDNINPVFPRPLKKVIKELIQGVSTPEELIVKIKDSDNKYAKLLIENKEKLISNFQLMQLNEIKIQPILNEGKNKDYFIEKYGMRSLDNMLLWDSEVI